MKQLTWRPPHRSAAVAPGPRNRGRLNVERLEDRTCPALANVSLAVDAGQTFQTIDGLGVNVNSHSWNNGEVIPALDMLHDQMGATLYRVVYDMEDWEQTNDNADPFTPDWTYYDAIYSDASFQNLWSTLRYLNQKGVTGGIVLSFMGRVPPWMGGSVIDPGAEDYWVEMMATVVYYARNTAHVQFSTLDPLNEPDWDGIEGPQVSAAQYVRLLDKLSARLDAMGLGDVHFSAPNTADVTTGVNTYIPALMADPVLMAKIDHFGLHNYTGSTGGADAAIKQSAYPAKDFWMTEVTNPGQMLAQLGGNASAELVWDGFDSAYIHPTLHGASMVPPNDASADPAPLAYDVATGLYTPRKSFYQDEQIFRFVPPGSVRIGAVSSDPDLTAYAFYDRATGRVTIVGQNTGPADLALAGSLADLPPVTSLQAYETDATNNFARLADVPVVGGAFSAVAPANSFFTLTGQDTTPPTVSITSPAGGSTVSGAVTVSADAADNVGVVGVQFKLDGANLGAEATAAPYSVSWNTATAGSGTHTLTAVARDAAGNTTTSAAVTVTVGPHGGGGVAKPFAAGADAGGAPQVIVYNPDGTVQSNFAAFDPGFTGGVRVAVADVNGDGVPDLIVGTGPGVPARVRVFSGADRSVLFDVQPFEATFTGGVYVAAGDLTGDGLADLVITPDQGGGPRVLVYRGGDFARVANFFGIDDPNFRGGARAAVGDVNGDGRPDLVVAAGFGGGPRVAVFDGRSVTAGPPVRLVNDFFVFEPTLRNGVFVAAGDLNGDGFADVIVGGGPGGGPRVLALSGKDLVAGTMTPLANFFAGDPNNRGGVRLAVKDLDGDSDADLVTGSGSGGGSRVTGYAGRSISAGGTPPEFLSFDAFAGFAGGVFVG